MLPAENCQYRIAELGYTPEQLSAWNQCVKFRGGVCSRTSLALSQGLPGEDAIHRAGCLCPRVEGTVS